MPDNTSTLPYDPSDRESIVRYAERLVGSTLREHVDVDGIDDPKKRRGSFGNAVERYYFKYDLNSESAPDFPEVGMELKTTPLKRTRSGLYSAKERLVITMINYMAVVAETFETSTLLEKASDILLISYLHEPDKDPLDYVIEIVAEWGLPVEDMPVFKADWETVVNKVRAGRAHEISGSDTLYLEACTKGARATDRRQQPFSDEPAKPRAWALKASYMTAVSNGLLEQMEPIRREPGERMLPLLDLVRERFEPYFGLAELELGERFGYVKEGTRPAKNLCELVTKRILGMDEDAKIAEFEKAGIKPKTVRLKRSGRPKEAMSFPFFDYFGLVETEFEDSDFFGHLQQKYLFVIYREDESERGVYRLSDVMFWQMPESDYDEARRCYDQMRRNVAEGRAEVSVKSTENRCCHVRPHDTRTSRPLPTPQGTPMKRKCFWFNQGYLQEEIAKALGEYDR